jgi:hypothetical protein
MKRYCSCLAFILIVASIVLAQKTPQGSEKKQPDPDFEKHVDWITKDLEAGWDTFSVSDTFMYKYDPKSIEWTSQTTVNVQIRGYVSFGLAKGRAHVIEERRRLRLSIESYVHFDMFAAQFALNCASQEVTSAHWTDYDIDRGVIGELPVSQRVKIVPGSVEENLFNVLCLDNFQSPTQRLPKRAHLGY